MATYLPHWSPWLAAVGALCALHALPLGRGALDDATRRASWPGCNQSAAEKVDITGPKVTRTFKTAIGQTTAWWFFEPVEDDLSISVTPSSPTMDPDVRLATLNDTGECSVFVTAQDIGGETLLLPAANKTDPHVLFFLSVHCEAKDCEYHVSFINRRLRKEDAQSLKVGDRKTGLAYRGVPLRFYLDCTDECERAGNVETNPRLTFSVWPRDATSADHLSLLVRKDEEPSSKIGGHFPVTRGWFSGQVVSTAPSAGRFHVVVFKKQGVQPLPFVLTVRLPQTLEIIPLGKPVFGAVSQNQVAFYKFQVTDPNTDIEVYLTKLDGDPDVSLSHGDVTSHPTSLSAQWHSRKVGDDELIVPPDDPKRKLHPTGWFHIGIQGYRSTAFSLIVLAEPHVNSTGERPDSVIEWTELYLGMPQSMAVQPDRQGNFLFYSRLATPKVIIHLQVEDDTTPNVCVTSCGPDPHRCPYLSPLAADMTRRHSPAISDCAVGKLFSAQGETELAIHRPCDKCWYAILVTTKAPRSKFRLLLGADGRAHPLTTGETFQGHVDANDSAVILVYDLPRDLAVEQGRRDGKLRATLTPIYGDPVFSVSLMDSTGKEGDSIFDSAEAGRGDWELVLQNSLAKAQAQAGLYYFEIRASSQQHAQFRFQVSWDSPLPGVGVDPAGTKSVVASGSLASFGLPVLDSGKVQDGSLVAGRPDIFLYRPMGEGKPTYRVTATSLGAEPCRLFAVALPVDDSFARQALVRLAGSPDLTAQWRTTPGSEVMTIKPSDPHYLAPGSDGMYAIVVASGAIGYVATHGSGICKGDDALIIEFRGPLEGRSEQECYQECETNSRCTWFAHYPGGQKDPTYRNRCALYRSCAAYDPLPAGVTANTVFMVTKQAAWHTYVKVSDTAHCCASRGAIGVSSESDPDMCKDQCSARSACHFFSHSVVRDECVFCSLCNLTTDRTHVGPSAGGTAVYTSWMHQGHGVQKPVEGQAKDDYEQIYNSKTCLSSSLMARFEQPGKSLQECYGMCAALPDCAFFAHWPKGSQPDEKAFNNECRLYMDPCDPWEALKDGTRNMVYRLTSAKYDFNEDIGVCLMNNGWYSPAALKGMDEAAMRDALVQRLVSLPGRQVCNQPHVSDFLCKHPDEHEGVGVERAAVRWEKQEIVSNWDTAHLVQACPQVGRTDHMRYSLEVAVQLAGWNASHLVNELPATGIPLGGVIKKGQYQKYRVPISAPSRTIAVSLVMHTGDADLFIGFWPNVTRETAILKGEGLGSDTVFIDGTSTLNTGHCSQEVIKQAGECSYFIAVYGVSTRSTFELSAHAIGGAPQPLMPGLSLPVTIAADSWQFFYLPIILPMLPISIEVTQQAGEVDTMHVKVTSRSIAEHPGATLASIRDASDYLGSKFAGVWSLSMQQDDLAALCRMAAVGSGCAAVVAIHTKSGVLGKVILASRAALETYIDPARTAEAKVAAVVLEDGVPARGELSTNEEILCFSFNVPDTSADLLLSVTPASNCEPVVQVTFPEQLLKNGSYVPRDVRPLTSDTQLHYVSTVISKSDPFFSAGKFFVWVRQAKSGACRVDVRAQLATSLEAGDLTWEGSTMPSLVLLDVPLFSSTDGEKYFVFTTQIKFGAPPQERDRLEVVVTSVAGEIQIFSTFIVEGKDTKEERLKNALQNVKRVEPAGGSGGARVFVMSGFSDGCGPASMCQVLFRVENARPGSVADFLVTAADRSARAPALLSGVPVRSCLGSCQMVNQDGKDATFQFLLTNPTAVLNIRLMCQGSNRNDCKQVLLSADTRQPLPEGSLSISRGYLPTVATDATQGELEVDVRLDMDRSSKGTCQAVPCMLYIRAELRSGAQLAGSGVEFELVATVQGSYILLLDGDEPMTVEVRPSRSVYFLFDSRTQSREMSIVANVPYDGMDPRGELVSMFVLGCNPVEIRWECHYYTAAEQRMNMSAVGAEKAVCEMERADAFQYRLQKGSGTTLKGCPSPCPCCRRFLKRGVAEARSPSDYPSAENYQFRGLHNSRGQLVAAITRKDVNGIEKGAHCYYRIAIISHRLSPAQLSVRGFDLRDNVALPFNTPLEVSMKADEKRSFQLPKPLSDSRISNVYVSMELCAGKASLRSGAGGAPGAPVGPGAFTGLVRGAVEPTLVGLRDNQLLEVQAAGEADDTATFIVVVEEPAKHAWLEVRTSRSLSVTLEGQDAIVSWQPAALLGDGQPSGGRDDAATYEVFWLREYTAPMGAGNLSSACGLYAEYKNRIAAKMHTKTDRTATIRNLDANVMYMFNVVARSVSTGHSVAYEPRRVFVPGPAFAAAGAAARQVVRQTTSLFWDLVLPMSFVGVVLTILWRSGSLSRCYGQTAGRRPWDVEMASRSARSWGTGLSPTWSSSLAPSIVGTSESMGGYGQLRA